MPQLHAAVAQPMTVPGEVETNIAQMRPLVREASRRGAQLVLFSESSLTGYDLKGVGYGAALPLDDDRLRAVAAMAAEFRIAIVAGLYEKTPEGIYNTAVAYLPDGGQVVQRKHHIVGYEVDGVKVLAGPRERVLFDVSGVRCGILICADSGIPGILPEMAGQGCDLVLAPTAGCGSADWGFLEASLDDPVVRRQYMEKCHQVCYPQTAVEQALDLKMGIVACNQAGYDEASGYFQPGHSSIIDTNGALVALIPGQPCYEHLRTHLADAVIHVTQPHRRRETAA